MFTWFWYVYWLKAQGALKYAQKEPPMIRTVNRVLEQNIVKDYSGARKHRKNKFLSVY